MQSKSLDTVIHPKDMEELMALLHVQLQRYRHKMSATTTKTNGKVTDIELNIKISK
jgi:DNA-binding response OmpR family regulator